MNINNLRFLVFFIIVGTIRLGMLIMDLIIDRKKNKRVREIILKEEKRNRSKFSLL